MTYLETYLPLINHVVLNTFSACLCKIKTKQKHNCEKIVLSVNSIAHLCNNCELYKLSGIILLKFLKLS